MPFRALIARGPGSFLHAARATMPEDLDGRRLWLLALGLAWLAGLFGFGLLALAGHASSYLGAWTFLWAPIRAIEPPGWVFWLGDARVPGLLFCSLIGFLPSLLSGRNGWAWVFAPVFLFVGVISLAGAWTLVVGERLGFWMRQVIRERDRILRRDVALRLALAIVVWVGLVFLGAALRDWVQYVVARDAETPIWKLLRWSFGLALIAAVETALTMGVFHFYFIFISRRRVQAESPRQ